MKALIDVSIMEPFSPLPVLQTGNYCLNADALALVVISAGRYRADCPNDNWIWLELKH